MYLEFPWFLLYLWKSSRDYLNENYEPSVYSHSHRELLGHSSNGLINNIHDKCKRILGSKSEYFFANIFS